MRTAEWFACIHFYIFDILIPQDSIITTDYNDNSIPVLSLDSAIRNAFKIHTPYGGTTRIFLKSRQFNIVSTSCKISLEQIMLKEFSILPKIMLQPMLESGITAIRFYQNKSQYLINVQKFLGTWNSKNDFSTYR